MRPAGGGSRPAASSRSRPTTWSIANLDPTLERRPPADDPLEVLSAFPYPLATAEVAAVMAEHLAVPDLVAAETALITATGEGRVSRRPVGDGSLWALSGERRPAAPAGAAARRGT